MAKDSRAYDITQFTFDHASQALADRTHRRLCARLAQSGVRREELYYVAASAVECLANRRSDYEIALSRGAPLAMCIAGARVARADAHFYFTLVRRWAAKRQSATPDRFRLAG